jgi:hypothetical protein
MSDEIRDPEGDPEHGTVPDEGDFATWFDDHFDADPSAAGDAENAEAVGDTLVADV